MAGVEGPMVYPFLASDPTLRRRLIAQKVYVATYWQRYCSAGRRRAGKGTRRAARCAADRPALRAQEMQFIVEAIDGGRRWRHADATQSSAAVPPAGSGRDDQRGGGAFGGGVAGQ